MATFLGDTFPGGAGPGEDEEEARARMLGGDGEAEPLSPGPARSRRATPGRIAALGAATLLALLAVAATVFSQRSAAPLGVAKVAGFSMLVEEALACPASSRQVGELGADIFGCGLEACQDRYDSPSIVACREKCEASDRCYAFSWSPLWSDRGNAGSAVCSLYDKDAPTGSWGSQAIFCKLEVAQPVQEKATRRKKLRIERDLGASVTETSVGKGASRAPSNASDCTQRADTLFDSVMMHSGLDKELAKGERGAFRARFGKVMEEGCQSDPLFISKDSHWLEAAKHALEEEKPVMSAALALNLNRANFGFFLEMQDWMVHESKASFRSRLGRTSSPPSDANITTPRAVGRQGGWVPPSFNSAERWPECRTEILRVHDQGMCGSCWSFSCSQVLNARICIQSNGKFDGEDASVAPGFFASCAAHGGHPGDGCTGGWEYFCYQYIDRYGTPGAVSESCSPYFGVGKGINHFKSRSTAPECPSRCQDGYERTLAEDGFKLPGVSAYRLLMPANFAAHSEAKRAILEGGTVNHGIYASGHFMGYSGGVYNLCTGRSANHAVVTYGWFPGGYLSKNSWGVDWGEGGLMRVANCIITDFTIPGDFTSMGSQIPYPLQTTSLQ